MAKQNLVSFTNLTDSSRNTRETIQENDFIRWTYDGGTIVECHWPFQTISDYSASIAEQVADDDTMNAASGSALINEYSSSYGTNLANYRLKN